MNIDKIAFGFNKKIKFDSSSNVNSCNCESFDEVLKKEEANVKKYAVPELKHDKPPMLKYAVPPYLIKHPEPKQKDFEEEPPKPMYAVPPVSR